MTYVTFCANFDNLSAKEKNSFKKRLYEYNLDENPHFENLWSTSIENDNIDEVSELLINTMRICKDEAKITKDIKILAQIGNNSHILL